MTVRMNAHNFSRDTVVFLAVHGHNLTHYLILRTTVNKFLTVPAVVKVSLVQCIVNGSV